MRDPYSTVTGWRWLDKLTLPFWAAYCKYHEWRFFRHIGQGDAQRGKRLLRNAIAEADEVNTEALNQ